MKDQNGDNFENCDFDKPANESKVCQVDLKDFGDCSRQNSYGYKSASPCVFLKLNKIYGWVPEYYTNATDEMKEYDSDFARMVDTVG
jgi:sodium/potassium-transporting ATPase subunit beta